MYHELTELIDKSSSYLENEFQEKIFDIFNFIFPKYIYYKREILIDGIDTNDKRPDFIIVDYSGYVDVLEIKKPEAKILSMVQKSNNYVPSHTLSCAIQQLEKYTVCLNRNGKKGDEELAKKFKNIIPNDFKLNSINSQGILIIGDARKELQDDKQRQDFEIIKRQYKHIIDIYTYDELLSMLKNMIDSLRIK